MKNITPEMINSLPIAESFQIRFRAMFPQGTENLIEKFRTKNPVPWSDMRHLLKGIIYTIFCNEVRLLNFRHLVLRNQETTRHYKELHDTWNFLGMEHPIDTRTTVQGRLTIASIDKEHKTHLENLQDIDRACQLKLSDEFCSAWRDKV